MVLPLPRMDWFMTLHKYLHKNIWPSPQLLREKNNRKWKLTNRKCYSHNRVCMDFSEEEVKSLSTSELDAHSSNVKEKKCVGYCWGSVSSNERLLSATGVYFRVSLGVINNQELFSGAWVFFQARTIWEPPLWERRAMYGVYVNVLSRAK